MNRKLLLVYDDYSEMIRTQTELMKIGFDVVGIVNEALMPDQLLVFNPEVVITAGRGGKVSAPSVAQKLKENPRYHGRVIMLLPHTQRPSAEELLKIRMDSLVEFPCSVSRLIQTIAKNLKTEAEPLLEKYRRIRQSEGASPEELQQIRAAPRDRASRYEKATRGIEIDTQSTTFDRTAVKEHLDAMKKDWDFEQLDEIDREKLEFAKALFRK